MKNSMMPQRGTESRRLITGFYVLKSTSDSLLDKKGKFLETIKTTKKEHHTPAHKVIFDDDE